MTLAQLVERFGKLKSDKVTGSSPVCHTMLKGCNVQINQKDHPNRVFVIVEKLKSPNKHNLNFKCKLLDVANYATALQDYADMARYDIVAVPDIYKQALINNCYGCMETMGYFAHTYKV